MEIKKEREAFEQHLTNTGLVEFSDYGFAVDECDEYLHEPTQVAWDSWLIGLNRAKAQAVPDGFAVVPIEITPKQIEAYMKGKVFPASMGEHRKFVERLSKDYKAMLEAAQEPANEL